MPPRRNRNHRAPQARIIKPRRSAEDQARLEAREEAEHLALLARLEAKRERQEGRSSDDEEVDGEGDGESPMIALDCVRVPGGTAQYMAAPDGDAPPSLGNRRGRVSTNAFSLGWDPTLPRITAPVRHAARERKREMERTAATLRSHGNTSSDMVVTIVNGLRCKADVNAAERIRPRLALLRMLTLLNLQRKTPPIRQLRQYSVSAAVTIRMLARRMALVLNHLNRVMRCAP